LTRPAPEITPWRIEIEQAVLDDLVERLARSRLGDEPDGVGWDYGTSLPYLEELVRYWITGFDWRRWEEALNALHHFHARVDGLEIHFAHHVAPAAGSLPLLLIHGWPTGFPEMTRLVPLLEADFDIIVPSLPGYSFSGAPRPGYGYHRAAQDLHRVLTGGLGYRRFGVHSTGAGAFVAGWLALEYPEAVAGLHTHDPVLMPPPSFESPAPPPSEAEVAFLERSRSWSDREGAYAEVHRTKPQNLAPALQDSPAGLAAWLVDKYRTWSDCGGDLESRWPKDDLLTVITLHWVTGDIGSSMRAYYERVHHDHLEPGVRLRVPTGVAMPRDDANFPPRRAPREMVRRTHNLQHWVDLPKGGHFASWEEPELVSASIRTFFKELS
jgi:pimeloyl-ACP methyl ester carboxylesterase